MSWSIVKSRGIGKVKYALVIEGWPYIYVTDPLLLLSTDKGDRTVLEGMLYEGLKISERAYPGEGRLESQGITFKFRPTHGRKTTSGTTDPISTSFAKRGTAVGSLGASLSDTALTISMVGASTLSNNTYYYVGTETIKTATFPTISRGNFNSYPQRHGIVTVDSPIEVRVYDYPTTVNGRRVWLYAYGEGDSVLTLPSANIIWRGHVVMPPRLDRDGVTWSLACEHVIGTWKQPVVGTEVKIRPVGIYHHALNPFVIALASGSTVHTPIFIGGFHASPDDLVEAVNVQLLAALSAASISTNQIAYMRVQFNQNTQGYELVVRTGSSPPASFTATAGSLLVGLARFGEFLPFGGFISADFSANTTYTVPFMADPGFLPAGTPMLGNGAVPQTGLGGPSLISVLGEKFTPSSTDAIHDYSPWRLYVDKSWTTVTGSGNESLFQLYIDPSTVVIEREAWGTMTNGGGAFTVESGQDGTAYYLDLTPVGGVAGISTTRPQAPFRGFITGETVMRPLFRYANTSAATNVLDFIEKLIDRKVDANDGVTPLLTGDDFDTSATFETEQPEWVRDRLFAFLTPVSIEEVVAPELLLAGHMLYTTETGKISVRRMPVFTDATSTSKTVTNTHIVTPADGWGAWPGYELQPQGDLSSVVIKQGYDPAADDWTGTKYEFRDADLIARNKKRSVREISPRSVPASGETLDLEDLVPVATRLMALMGREYAAVRVQVPYTCFNYLLGEIVKLTSPHVPNASDGSRGVTAKRAVVMGRNWNLDPAKEEWGELELWILLDAGVAGYAPSAYITAQTNTSGNTWNLTCSVSNGYNLAFSTNNDGQCLEHFADGDYIKICRLDGTTEVTGRISGTPNAAAGTCTVNLDSTWTPSTFTWSLEYRSDNGSTAQAGQRAFVYIADNDKKLANGNSARSFS